ncbi:hypothetical protein P8452_24518 [Trifolium repens]|nr:hypothetical protein P8452_24518 [Trifolium repens]
MPFSPSLRFRKGVTNFPKICLCYQNLSTFEECIRLGIKTLPNVWAGKADGLFDLRSGVEKNVADSLVILSSVNRDPRSISL